MRTDMTVLIVVLNSFTKTFVVLNFNTSPLSLSVCNNLRVVNLSYDLILRNFNELTSLSVRILSVVRCVFRETLA
jgi:hypothetical protein